MLRFILFLGFALLTRIGHAQTSSVESQLAELKKQNELQQTQLDKITADMGARKNPTSNQGFIASSMIDTQISGYGEINYNKYLKDNSRTQMDLRRFVIFLGHRFTDDINFVSEVEWEHAVTSNTDKGESEIEQAYLNFRLSPKISLKAGLFLMPFGFLNESHEPPTFYGVERNEVETRIIPSTWREGGLGLYGSLDSGFDWNLGVTTGFDVAKFDDSGPGSPLAAQHQELQFAKAEDLAVYGALNYRVPGLVLGGGLFSGKSVQGNAEYKNDPNNPNLGGINGRILLGDVHARIQQHGWDVEALIAKGYIGDASQIDDAVQTFNTVNANTPNFVNRNFVPAEFYGWLVQAAYRFSIGSGDATISPFARYEEYDTQLKMPLKLESSSLNRDHVTTLGLSYHPDPQVVVKADYQAYSINTANSRCNLGLGYMF